MSGALADIARAIAESRAHDVVVHLLSNVPGLPPIVQTVHLLAIATVMGSIVVICLKMLGLALPSQSTEELVRRLLPWTWSALPVLLASGLVFVIARPRRYFSNPVFGLKLALIAFAILMASVLHVIARRSPGRWDTAAGRRGAKLMAGVSLAAWVSIVLAGRWIAYADYLFPEE
ncbi:MAG: DUF6644 family protein [Steroidobacteraceae bacterium]